MDKKRTRALASWIELLGREHSASDVGLQLKGCKGIDARMLSLNATLGTISYTSNNTTVFVQDGQSFGVVTASFADNLYKSSFKQNSITANFKG